DTTAGVVAPAHRLCEARRETADEDRQLAEQRLLGRCKEVVAPRDGAAEGLQTCWRLAWSPGQYGQAAVESLQECLGRQKLRARRGELNRQWQPVQLSADGRDGSGILVC